MALAARCLIPEAMEDQAAAEECIAPPGAVVLLVKGTMAAGQTDRRFRIMQPVGEGALEALAEQRVAEPAAVQEPD